MKSIERRRRPAWGYLLISLLLALLLNFLPVPDGVLAWWPDWVLLVAFYWALVMPQHWGVFASWSAGLFEDIASYALLGYHAITVALMAMIAGAANRRLNLFNPLEQVVVVFVLVLTVLLLRLWIDRLLGQPVSLDVWKSALSSALVWPFLAVLLTRFDPKVRRFGQG